MQIFIKFHLFPFYTVNKIIRNIKRTIKKKIMISCGILHKSVRNTAKIAYCEKTIIK